MKVKPNSTMDWTLVRGDVWWGRSKKKGMGGTWVVEKKKWKEKRNEEVVRGWWGKRKRNKKQKINNIMIKIKFKIQNYVSNTIFFFLNCDFSCETKTIYQTEFFYNLEFKSGLKF